MKKKVDALSKEKGCEVASKWSRSIINHLYWCASSSEGSGDLILAKWHSVINHVQNVHKHHDNPLFPECLHGKLEGRERAKKWLKPGTTYVHAHMFIWSLLHVHTILLGTKACDKLVKILSSPYLKGDVCRLSPDVQTSSVESYHSVVNHFAPKLLSFSYEGMTCR